MRKNRRIQVDAEARTSASGSVAAAPQLTPHAVSRSLRGTVLTLLLAAAVVAAAAFAHWPVLDAKALTFDDEAYLTHNALVQQPGWASAARFLSEVLQPSTVPGYYQPLAMISLMLDTAMGGRPDHLRPFHRTSLILHLANTALIIWLVQALFGQPWIAAAAGLLFGVHPLTVEPIAWIGERKTTLAAFFALFCLVVYVRHAAKGGCWRYALSLTLFALALLSKPITAPLPLFLILLDYWPLHRVSRRKLLEKIPFLVLTALFAVITVVSQGRSAVVGMPTEYVLARMPLIVSYDLLFYLRKIIWPVNLTSHYPVPLPLTWSNPVLLASLILTAGLMAAVLLSLRRTRAPLVGLLIFFLGLFPTMGLVGFTKVLTSDKYVYLPAVGIILLLAAGVVRLVGTPASPAPAWRSRGVAAGVIVAAGLLTWCTRSYLQEWQTTGRHALYMVRLAPDAAPVHSAYGNYLNDEHHYAEAVAEFDRVIQLTPRYAPAYNNRSIALGSLGDYAGAIRDAGKAIDLDPGYAEACYNRALSYHNTKDLDAAIRDYTQAIELKGDYPKAYYNRGTAWQAKGDLPRAIEDYTSAIRLRPQFAEAYHSRAVAYYLMKNYPQAWADLQVVQRLGARPNPAFLRDLLQASSRPGT